MSNAENVKEGEINLIDLWFTIWGKKFVIALVCVAALILAVIVSFLSPETFKSTSVFLPITSGGSGSNLAQYAGLAAMAGVSLPSGGGGNDTKKIQTLLNSRTLREKIVTSLNLVSEFEIESIVGRDPARMAVDALEKMIKISSGKNGEIELTVETKNPILSQKIASQYVVELQLALNESNLSVSIKERSLNERQLADQSQRLRKTQEALARFQTKNKILDPSSQLQGFSTLFAELYSQKVQLEIQLKQMESAYNPTDTQLVALQSQIKSIDKQISEIQNNQSNMGGISFSEAPEQMIEYQNLMRDLEIATKIYAGLLANLEQNRLSNNSEKVFVEVIDPPLVPEVRSAPNRTMIVVVGTLAGFFLSILGIFLWEGIMKLRKEYLFSRKQLPKKKVKLDI